MNTIAEIEGAIEKLPEAQVKELAIWLEAHLARRAESLTAEAWLNRAHGAARPGATTTEVMTLLGRTNERLLPTLATATP